MNKQSTSLPKGSVGSQHVLTLVHELSKWFRNHGRDLPWRHTRNPYKILISEIMLQQTNVNLVIPIYTRFLRKFPTIQSLAASEITEIRAITDQLGYKRRAMYLHQIATAVATEKGGTIPSTLEGLQSLIGIGRYTAGAILSFAFERQDRTAAIVDVNVERVISRMFGLWKRERNSSLEKEIWHIAEEITITSRDTWTINQGLLDLGATICVAQKPKCHLCPVKGQCKYYIQEVPKVIPLDSFFT